MFAFTIEVYLTRIFRPRAMLRLSKGPWQIQRCLLTEHSLDESDLVVFSVLKPLNYLLELLESVASPSHRGAYGTRFPAVSVWYRRSFQRRFSQNAIDSLAESVYVKTRTSV